MMQYESCIKHFTSQQSQNIKISENDDEIIPKLLKHNCKRIQNKVNGSGFLSFLFFHLHHLHTIIHEYYTILNKK